MLNQVSLTHIFYKYAGAILFLPIFLFYLLLSVHNLIAEHFLSLYLNFLIILDF